MFTEAWQPISSSSSLCHMEYWDMYFCHCSATLITLEDCNACKCSVSFCSFNKTKFQCLELKYKSVENNSRRTSPKSCFVDARSGFVTLFFHFGNWELLLMSGNITMSCVSMYVLLLLCLDTTFIRQQRAHAASFRESSVLLLKCDITLYIRFWGVSFSEEL